MPTLWPADPAHIDRAATHLSGGGLVGVPTETVYGLAGDAANGRAVASIYETKGRPRFNPLIVHVETREAAHSLGMLSPVAEALAEAFWPGPLTLVVPKRQGAPVADLVTAGLDTIALRVPAHPVARALLQALGRPFVAPSANRSGRVSPTSAQHVADGFEADFPVLDGGPCDIGLESTILAVEGDAITLLRPGAVLPAEIEALTGIVPRAPEGAAITAPGMLASHYAPAAPVRLNAGSARDGEILLGFGGTPGAALDLSPTGDLREAAATLFAALRSLDREGRPIAIVPIPKEGLGLAINDRLTRAAAPRTG